MATPTTRMTFDEFKKLPEPDGGAPIYELDEGTLLMEPSPAYRHNLVRKRIAWRLDQFVKSHSLGDVTEETDFRLGEDTVRKPDVAFVTNEHLSAIDLDRSPVDGAPALAVEVVSPNNTAQETRKKVGQYLAAGSRAVWVVYPDLQLVELHSAGGSRTVSAPNVLQEETLFPNRVFSLSLVDVFEGDPRHS